jgi:hypothetical protein
MMFLNEILSWTDMFTKLTSRRMRWAGHVACTETTNADTVLAGKPEGK